MGGRRAQDEIKVGGESNDGGKRTAGVPALFFKTSVLEGRGKRKGQRKGTFWLGGGGNAAIKT